MNPENSGLLEGVQYGNSALERAIGAVCAGGG